MAWRSTGDKPFGINDDVVYLCMYVSLDPGMLQAAGPLPEHIAVNIIGHVILAAFTRTYGCQYNRACHPGGLYQDIWLSI